MTTKKYYDLQEEAGDLFRAGDYFDSIKCCYEIAVNIPFLKKQILGFKEINKDFVFYTILNLLKVGDNEMARAALEIIINSDILKQEQFQEDLEWTISFEIDGSPIISNYENVKFCISYFRKINLLSLKQEQQYLYELDKSVTGWKKYFEEKEKITSQVLAILKNGSITQKQIYKAIKDFDGRTILSVLKELERKNIIKRDKQGSDYLLTAK